MKIMTSKMSSDELLDKTDLVLTGRHADSDIDYIPCCGDLGQPSRQKDIDTGCGTGPRFLSQGHLDRPVTPYGHRGQD